MDQPIKTSTHSKSKTTKIAMQPNPNLLKPLTMTTLPFHIFKNLQFSPYNLSLEILTTTRTIYPNSDTSAGSSLHL